MGRERYKGSSLEVTYRVLWLTEEGLEELPNLSQLGAVSNNFHPICKSDTRSLTATTDYILEDGHERFQCTLSA